MESSPHVVSLIIYAFSFQVLIKSPPSFLVSCAWYKKKRTIGKLVISYRLHLPRSGPATSLQANAGWRGSSLMMYFPPLHVQYRPSVPSITQQGPQRRALDSTPPWPLLSRPRQRSHSLQWLFVPRAAVQPPRCAHVVVRRRHGFPQWLFANFMVLVSGLATKAH